MTHTPTLDARKQAAFNHARNGQFAEAEAALQSVLQEAPRDLGALLLLGDVQHTAGKTQDASRAYGGAMQVAQMQGGPIPDVFKPGLQRAASRLGEYASQYEAFIAAQIPPASRSARFDQSVNILLGKAPIHLQQPTKYYFPELPQIQFYNRSDFDWAPALEAQTPAIQQELSAVLADHAAFRPYLERDESKPHVKSHDLVDNDDWSAFYLWKDGARVEENCARCPVTAAAFENHGLINPRLICHLPLRVPGPAWLRVGNQTHHWKEGELVIFDDSIEHEAKNEASETRVVLLFDIWRPELSLQEREEVTRLLGAIAQYSGEAVVSGN